MCHATNYFPRLKLLTYFHCDIVHMINALISWHDSIPPPLSPPLPSCPCYRCTASLGNASRRSPIAVSLCQRTANARQSPCYSFNLHFSNATLIDIGQRTVDNGQRQTVSKPDRIGSCDASNMRRVCHARVAFATRNRLDTLPKLVCFSASPSPFSLAPSPPLYHHSFLPLTCTACGNY